MTCLELEISQFLHREGAGAFQYCNPKRRTWTPMQKSVVQLTSKSHFHVHLLAVLRFAAGNHGPSSRWPSCICIKKYSISFSFDRILFIDVLRVIINWFALKEMFQHMKSCQDYRKKSRRGCDYSRRGCPFVRACVLYNAIPLRRGWWINGTNFLLW